MRARTYPTCWAVAVITGALRVFQSLVGADLDADGLLDPAMALATKRVVVTTLASKVGASTKTVTRLYKSETGMNYQDWRQQWRLLKAVELLSTGMQVSAVADWLAFSSTASIHRGKSIGMIKGMSKPVTR